MFFWSATWGSPAGSDLGGLVVLLDVVRQAVAATLFRRRAGLGGGHRGGLGTRHQGGRGGQGPDGGGTRKQGAAVQAGAALAWVGKGLAHACLLVEQKPLKRHTAS